MVNYVLIVLLCCLRTSREHGTPTIEIMGCHTENLLSNLLSISKKSKLLHSSILKVVPQTFQLGLKK